MDIIKLKNITHKYEVANTSVPILNNINLKLESEKMYAIMGTSGSGKTTLLNILGGLIKPSEGEVYIGNKMISGLNEKEMAAFRLKNIGYIFQNFNLISFLNVEENIFFPLRLLKKNINNYKDKYKYLLKELDLEQKRFSYINEMSGGQQQRVAIARCLLVEPQDILADEPTGSLDSKNSAKVMEMLKKLHEENHITVVMVTHDEEMASYCDKVIKIKDGIVTII